MKKVKRKGKQKKTTRRQNDFGKIDLPKKTDTIKIKPELIHDNPFQVSESIAKSILDKIIILSVRKSYINNLDKISNNYYYEYLHNQLNTLYATNYLFYYDEPETEKRNKMFWNQNFDKENTWEEITEPNSSQIDRYENVFMKYINYVPNSSKNERKKSLLNRSKTLDQENLVSQNKNELSEVLDKKIPKIESKKYSLKNLLNKVNKNEIVDILEEKSSSCSRDEENNDKKIKKLKLKKNSISNIRKSLKKSLTPRKDPNKDNLTKTLPPKKEQQTEIDNINKNDDDNDDDIIIYKSKNSKKQPILSMNLKEIPGIDKEFNFDCYSPPDVDELRKEIEEEKIRKEKEGKKFALIKKISINNSDKNNDMDNKLKVFDSNKLTFDSNGKIMSFKPIKIENLTKDFVSLKNGIKSPETNIENNLKRNNTRKNRNNKSREEARNKVSQEKQKQKEIIIKNPEDDPNGVHKYNFVKIATDRREQIIPSGSNFSLMLPNIGVTLKENDQIKEGKREFGKYFKKYSLLDYDRILRDYLPLQNKTMLKNKMNQPGTVSMNLSSLNKKINKNFSLNTNTSYKYNSSNLMTTNNNNINIPLTQTQNFNNTDLSNPLINLQEAIQENDLNNNNNSSFIKTAKSNISYAYSGNNLYSGNMMSKINNRSHFSEAQFIKLSKNCSSTSLKNEIENLKDLNDDMTNMGFYPKKIKLKTRNIFENNYKEFYKTKKIKKDKDINIGKNISDLNKKIMLTGGWGTQSLQKNNSSGNLLYSKHLTKYQALRELGSNLLNGIKVKLPRDRKVDINI